MSDSSSLHEFFLKRNHTGYTLPSLSDSLELVERCACWVPPTQHFAIGLWWNETGLTRSEFWDIAGLLIEAGEVAL